MRNSDEVFHAWAHQTQESGKSGNVRFDGPTLFSYAEPIGHLLPGGRVLLSSKNFSTTTSKHQRKAALATWHMVSMAAPVLPGKYGQGLEECHRDNKSEWIRSQVQKFAELSAHPRRKKSLTLEILRVIHHQNAYRDFFGLDWPDASFSSSEEECKEAAAIAAEQLKKDDERRAEQQRVRELAEAEALAEWRVGGAAGRWFQVMALRLKGDIIETSQGASIPAEHARKVWPLLKRFKDLGTTYERNGHTIYLGQFPLDSFDGAELKVGCHTIPWAEIEAMSQALGL